MEVADMSGVRTSRSNRAALSLHKLSDNELTELAEAVRNERLRRRFKDQHRTNKPDGRLVYVTWQDAVDALKPVYGGKAEHRASRVWGVLDRETLMGTLQIEGYCVHCARRLPKCGQDNNQVSHHQVGCPARSSYTSSTMSFSRRSLVQNLDKAKARQTASLPGWVADDYERIVKAVRRKKK